VDILGDVPTMTVRHSRLLSLDGRAPSIEAICDPSSAQLQLWLAQAQRDCRNIGDSEMAKMERAAAALAKRSRVMFNPFTGEIRKVDY
jgi:hypothetical protein